MQTETTENLKKINSLLETMTTENINLALALCLAAGLNSKEVVKNFLDDKKEYRYFTLKDSLAAVKQNGDSLQYVKEQTAAICLEAVKQNGYSLRYVKEQTAVICLEAVRQDRDSLRYVKL